MSKYEPQATDTLDDGPGHAKQHRVFVINTGPNSPDGSIEVGHYGDVYMPYTLTVGYGKPGYGVIDLTTYFAQLYHMDMAGFACDFDVPNGFMYPYGNVDQF